MAEQGADPVDQHVARWLAVLPDLDPVIEAVATRMEYLVKHLHRVKERALADHDLQPFEYATLHALAGRGGRATPSDLATDLRVSAATMTGRLGTLEGRDYLRRTHSATDRRRVDVELTPAGRDAWRTALDVQGTEEHRILGVLSPAEQAQLADFLRRVLIAAEERRVSAMNQKTAASPGSAHPATST